MKLFAATIHVLINAETQGEACDALGMLMRQEIDFSALAGTLIVHDWSYVREQAGDEWPKAIELPDDWCALNEIERHDAGLPNVQDVMDRALPRNMIDIGAVVARIINAYDAKLDDASDPQSPDGDDYNAVLREIQDAISENAKNDQRRFLFAVQYWNDAGDLMHSEFVDYAECPDLDTVEKEAREFAGEDLRYETIDKWSVTIDGPMRVSNAPPVEVEAS